LASAHRECGWIQPVRLHQTTTMLRTSIHALTWYPATVNTAAMVTFAIETIWLKS
jgi:hypothetical protein